MNAIQVSPLHSTTGLVNLSADSSPAAGPTGDAEPLLPEPVISGMSDGSIAELATLLTFADERDRAASRQLETITDQAATREENDRVHEMEAKADADRNQALASGIGQMVAGACEFVAAFGNPPAAADASSQSAHHGLNLFTAMNAAGQGASGGGQMVAGQFKADADNHDAHAARLDAQAQGDIRRENRAHEDAQAADASIQRVEQLVEQVQQTQNATRLEAATFRA